MAQLGKLNSPKMVPIFVDSKNRGGPPKWMVKIMENPIEMDDLEENPLFSETSIFVDSKWFSSSLGFALNSSSTLLSNGRDGTIRPVCSFHNLRVFCFPQGCFLLDGREKSVIRCSANG